MPSDIVGTRIFDQRESAFTTVRGPIFANVVLADEINRAPAKVQSALLEAMQEHQVTIGPQTHPLPDPFIVMATMNPLDSEGTYALPIAQMDRFLLKIDVGYPSRADELAIMERFAIGDAPVVTPVATLEQVRAWRWASEFTILRQRKERITVKAAICRLGLCAVVFGGCGGGGEVIPLANVPPPKAQPTPIAGAKAASAMSARQAT